jgi:PleD family two-component response regulator
MAQHQPTPVLALSSREEHTELINRLLRQAGQAAYCHRIAGTENLAEALSRYQPHLLFAFTANPSADVAAVAAVCEKISPILPIVAVGTAADEEQIAGAINAGARDLVSVAQPKRLLAVALRELRSYRLEKALRETLVSADQYRRELKAIMANSVEAIAYAQEGIVVRANPVWMELFGYTDSDDFTGMPLMDYFDAGSQAALKGALMACARQQWTTDLLRVVAVDKKGANLPIDLKIEEADFDNEPAVRLSVSNEQPARGEPEQLVTSTVHQDPVTGLYHRRQFVDLLAGRLENKSAGGVRALAYIRPDRFGEIKDDVGPLASEDVLIQIAEIIRGLTQENDICGRFGGVVFTALIERGTLPDLKAWAENRIRLVGSVGSHDRH